MSIEALIASQIEALNRNTEALLLVGNGAGKTAEAAKPTSAAGAKTEAAKPAASKTGSAAAKPAVAKPKHTEDDVVAALTKIKEEFGADAAKEVIKALGCAKMAEITADKYDQAVKLAEEKYTELTEAGNGDGDEDEGL